MNGEIRVESEIGKNSCFHFTADVGAVAETEHPALADTISLAGIPVLIVDDRHMP